MRKVIALLAAYNEADVIEQVVADLIAQGLSVYLIDHGSSDATVEQAAVHLGRGLLGIERFPDESGFPPELAKRFCWEQLLERKEQLSHSLDADWFLHTDADELRESPFPGRTLAEAVGEVEELGYNAIDFEVLNFSPTDDDFRPGDDLRRHFRFYQPARWFDRLQIKCWKKGAEVDLRSSGGHEARFAGRRVFPVRFLDRHYPVRSQAQGERKIFVERKPRFVGEERSRGWHVQYDGLSAGCSFICDPAQLLEYDPAAVRRALFAHPRESEATEAQLLAANEQLASAEAQLLAALDEARAAEQAQTALAAELRARLDEAGEDVRELRAAAELAGEESRARELRLTSELAGARSELREAELRLDELYASRGWRWTAAGRLAWRLLSVSVRR